MRGRRTSNFASSYFGKFDLNDIHKPPLDMFGIFENQITKLIHENKINTKSKTNNNRNALQYFEIFRRRLKKKFVGHSKNIKH